MCGIFGYVGKNKKPAAFILDGLKTLEYRGYDSWGLVVLSSNKLKRERHVGKIGEAKTVLPATTTGMGHTRWATHGGVTAANAHPHFDCINRFAVIHNGIIENEKELRQILVKKGHKFTSQTDTEVIVHLLEEEAKTHLGDLNQLVSQIAVKLGGAFAIGVMDRDRPGEIVLARFGGPLVVGLTDGYKLFASDPSALLPFTRQVIYLKDREIAWITSDNVEIMSFDNQKKRSSVTTLDWNVEKIRKGGYTHYMLKEIMEQPESLANTMRGRIDGKGRIKLGGLESVKDQLRDIEFIRFIACGSAYYAGLYGASVISELTGITATAEIASEYKYGSFNWPEKSAAWFISQSGETADVLGAIDKVKKEKILPLGLVNVVGSSAAQRTAAGVYLHAGPEVGVASTKAFVSQLSALVLIGIWLGQLREKPLADPRYHFLDTLGSGSSLISSSPPGQSKSKVLLGSSSVVSKMTSSGQPVVEGLRNLPSLIRRVLTMRQELKKLAKEIITKRQIFFMGRGRNYPLALEGALKLREVAYLDTLGLPTGELKHGPIAAMDKNRPAILLAPSDGMEMKNRSSAQELMARKIPVYTVTDLSGKSKFSDVADRLIVIPDVHPILQPILMAPVVQLLAYEAGVLLGRPIDKPRNLAKSVTVE